MLRLAHFGLGEGVELGGQRPGVLQASLEQDVAVLGSQHAEATDLQQILDVAVGRRDADRI